MGGNPCKCGCGQIVTSKKPDGTYRVWIWGHSSRARRNEWSQRPESTNQRTGRWRARRSVDTTQCAVASADCKGRIEVHHLDKNPLNGDLSNLVAVCKAHHAFLDLGKITMDNPVLPRYWVDGAGKRRYISPA